MTKAQKADQTAAIEQLRTMLKPGDTVQTILRSVSRSGMSRDISPILTTPDGGAFDASYLVGRALDLRHGKAGGLKMGGCGMDMGFALVYALSSKLYPNGFGCTGAGTPDAPFSSRCPSNDHSNGDRDYTPHQHRSGGYALRHAWL